MPSCASDLHKQRLHSVTVLQITHAALRCHRYESTLRYRRASPHPIACILLLDFLRFADLNVTFLIGSLVKLEIGYLYLAAGTCTWPNGGLRQLLLELCYFNHGARNQFRAGSFELCPCMMIFVYRTVL